MRIFCESSSEYEEGVMKILFGIGILLFILGLSLYLQKPCANFNEATLHTPTKALSVALATTPEAQSKGLGGCRYIPKNSGMYFVFTDNSQRTFWMKGMRIPIDIVWISQGRVVGIEKNVPNLPRSTSDSDLPQYKSPVPVDAVLEVEAGMAEAYGAQEGETLIVDKKW